MLASASGSCSDLHPHLHRLRDHRLRGGELLQPDRGKGDLVQAVGDAGVVLSEGLQANLQRTFVRRERRLKSPRCT